MGVLLSEASGCHCPSQVFPQSAVCVFSNLSWSFFEKHIEIACQRKRVRVHRFAWDWHIFFSSRTSPFPAHQVASLFLFFWCVCVCFQCTSRLSAESFKLQEMAVHYGAKMHVHGGVKIKGGGGLAMAASNNVHGLSCHQGFFFFCQTPFLSNVVGALSEHWITFVLDIEPIRDKGLHNQD